MDQTVLTTCPRDCYDACGILVSVRDGKIRHVRGDPNHPVSRGKLCRKCSIGYNGVFLDPERAPDAAASPQRAEGQRLVRAPSRGTRRWARSRRGSRLIAAGPGAGDDPERPLHRHLLADRRLRFPMRFFTRLGAREVDPDSVCNKAGHVALDYVVRHVARPASIRARRGTRPASWSGEQTHRRRRRTSTSTGCGTATAEVIVVDPVRTPTAAAADLHLQPFPGTDAALAFGLLHVIARDGLLDRAFLDEHAIGWEEVEPLLADCTPQRTEAVTGVPAELVERAARDLRAPGRRCSGSARGSSASRPAGNVVRAIALLPAATGNLGRAGRGRALPERSPGRRDGDRLVGAHLGTAPEPVSHMDLAAWLEDPAADAGARHAGTSTSPRRTPSRRACAAALEREDLFTVVVDLFATDTDRLRGLRAAGRQLPRVRRPHRLLLRPHAVCPGEGAGAARRVVAQPGDLPSAAGAMGFEEPELQESDEEVIAGLLAESGVGLELRRAGRRRHRAA